MNTEISRAQLIENRRAKVQKFLIESSRQFQEGRDEETCIICFENFKE